MIPIQIGLADYFGGNQDGLNRIKMKLSHPQSLAKAAAVSLNLLRQNKSFFFEDELEDIVAFDGDFPLLVADEDVHTVAFALVVPVTDPEIGEDFVLVGPDSDFGVAEDDVEIVVGDSLTAGNDVVYSAVGEGEDQTIAGALFLGLQSLLRPSSEEISLFGLDNDQQIFLTIDVLVDVGLVQRVEAVKMVRFGDAHSSSLFEEGHHELFVVFVALEGASVEEGGGGGRTDRGGVAGQLVFDVSDFSLQFDCACFVVIDLSPDQIALFLLFSVLFLFDVVFLHFADFLLQPCDLLLCFQAGCLSRKACLLRFGKGSFSFILLLGYLYHRGFQLLLNFFLNIDLPIGQVQVAIGYAQLRLHSSEFLLHFVLTQSQLRFLLSNLNKLSFSPFQFRSDLCKSSAHLFDLRILCKNFGLLFTVINCFCFEGLQLSDKFVLFYSYSAEFSPQLSYFFTLILTIHCSLLLI